MTTTWTVFLDRIRFMTDDEKRKVSDEQLLLVTNTCLNKLSRDAGPIIGISVSPSGDEIELPDDLNAVALIEANDGTTTYYLEYEDVRPGSEYVNDDTDVPQSYSDAFSSKSVRLLGTVGDETYKLYYVGTYPKITDNGNLPFGGWREVALMHLVMAETLQPIAYKRARLEQFSSAPDLKVGNPPNELAAWHMSEYRRIIAESK